MTTAFDVARYIVLTLGTVTTMKLQKLVYYSQAWTLVWDEEPLFEEDFQAWANGPVCPELYEKHRGVFRVGREFLAQEVPEPKLDDNQKENIRIVLDFYGTKTGHWLSELTHEEMPWCGARCKLRPGERGTEIIQKENMQRYYGILRSSDE